MYMPGNLVQELAQVSQQLGQINNQLAQLNGNCENLRIAAWNRHHALPVQFQPLLKTVR
jgi:conjugal transfer/entry exclusion protein